jgi:GNAT superfamily N-acetyltransferase
MIDIGLLNTIKLTPGSEIQPFDCGDEDLNKFLHEDAEDYYNELMGVTYSVEYGGRLVAYFCLFMDKVVFDFSGKDDPIRQMWKQFNKINRIHFNKQRKTYPAVKLGRVGVSVDFKGAGLGRYVVDTSITMVLGSRAYGCRFLTVDAYQEAFGFYLKLGFKFLSSEDEEQPTRQMYLDLKRVTNK